MHRASFLFCLLLLSPLSSLVLRSSSKEAPERRLLFLELSLMGVSAMGGYFYAKYLNGKGLNWASDKDWEKRFGDFSRGSDISVHFLKLLYDSYAVDLTNQCIVTWKDLYELEGKINEELYEKMIMLCDDWFDFMVRHSSITKYMMSSKHSLFYFKQSFRETDKVDLPIFDFFHRTLVRMIVNEKSPYHKEFKSMDEGHQKNFYTILNYFFESQSVLFSNN